MRFNHPLDRLLTTRSRVAVLRYLVLTGVELSGRQIARALGVSPKPLNEVLTGLADEGVLVRRTVGKTHLFRINRDNILVSELLLPLFEREHKMLSVALEEVFTGLEGRVRSAVLYGSVGRGEEGPDSDLDLLIVTEDAAVPKILEDRAVDFLKRYGNILSPLVITLNELRHRYLEGDEFLREALAQGQVVFGESPLELLRGTG